MRYEEDYIMRIIKEAVEVLARIIFHKKTPFYEMEKTNPYCTGDNLYERLFAMADHGKINEAENLLYQGLRPEDQNYLEIGLAFYHHINAYTDTFLRDHNYTRDEIKEGIRTLLKQYGMKELFGILDDTDAS